MHHVSLATTRLSYNVVMYINVCYIELVYLYTECGRGRLRDIATIPSLVTNKNEKMLVKSNYKTIVDRQGYIKFTFARLLTELFRLENIILDSRSII